MSETETFHSENSLNKQSPHWHQVTKEKKMLHGIYERFIPLRKWSLTKTGEVKKAEKTHTKKPQTQKEVGENTYGM